MFWFLVDFSCYRLANDAKGKGGERQFNGLIDVYTKTLKSDGIQGLYRGFTISAVGIFIYRGMYFGLFDTLKPILLGDTPNVTLSFLLGWGVTITAGLMSYPIGKKHPFYPIHIVFNLSYPRYHQKTYDDDLWWWSQVQGIH